MVSSSKKHLVFLHQTYPAQFGPIIAYLKQHHAVDITVITEFASKPPMPGIRYLPYKPALTQHEKNPYFFARYFEQECASMHGIYNVLQQNKLPPIDTFIGHAAFGTMGLLHVAYPDVPKIGFFELFYDPFAPEGRPEYPAQKPNRLRVPIRNATQLVELNYCTSGYSPTAFQKSTFPKEYQPKLSVIFDGVDTEFYAPGELPADSQLKRTWPQNAPIITYVSRGLEAMRGFDIFMDIAHEVSLKHPDVHFVIAGNPKTVYGSEMTLIKEPTFKEYVLKQHPYDRSRFHFVDWLPESALRDLFRISACHFYWTVPFTLSWSLVQAMATGALVVAGDSAPVRDLVQHGQNGFLVESKNIQGYVDQMLAILSNPKQFTPFREAARETAVTHFSFNTCLPKLAEFYLGE